METSEAKWLEEIFRQQETTNALLKDLLTKIDLLFHVSEAQLKVLRTTRE